MARSGGPAADWFESMTSTPRRARRLPMNRPSGAGRARAFADDATSVNQDELPSAVERLGLLGANWP